MRHPIFASVGLLTLLAAGSAFAQAAPLRVGDTTRDELAEGDASAEEGGHVYDAYAVRLRRGQRIEATLSAGDFDAYLEIYAPGDAATPTAFDDDGLGEGSDARLRFTAREAGDYVIHARGLTGEDRGGYVLAVSDRGAAPRAPRATGLRLGQTLAGNLGDRDPEADDGAVFDAFSFRARQGERVMATLRSEAFDPVLSVGRAGGDFVALAENDDGPGQGVNSRLIFTAPATGDYVLRASALAEGRGAYEISLEPAPEVAAAQAIELDTPAAGRLEDGDPVGEGGARADAYAFQGRAGQRLRITLTSADFDAYLELFDPARASLDQDDDSAGEGTNARITATLPADGVYTIEARAFDDGTGAYTLTVEEIAPERAPGALAFGATIEGEIADEDPRDDGDLGFDAFRFTGVGGQRVQAIMRSGDFDTFLRIGAAEGEFAVLAEDDDGLGEGTDSRLTFSLPEDGDYVVRASPLAADGEGLYSLELIDRGPQPAAGSLLVGTTARGTLTEVDATAEDDSYFDAYRIDLRADEKLVITMVSNEVDSLVAVGRISDGAAFEVLGADDDSLSDTHAKLEWTAPETGSYEIRAGTFQSGQIGAYALTVEKQP